MIQVAFSERFARKADLYDGRLSTKLAMKIDQLHQMDMPSLFSSAHLLKRLPDSGALWILDLPGNYKLIFRQVRSNTIELVDLVAHEDMDKFSRARR